MIEGFAVRRGTLADASFILSSWLKSYRKAQTDRMGNEEYFAAYHPKVAAAIDASQVTVVCVEDDPSVIMGYAISRDDHLLYIYVKAEARRAGLANAMLEELGFTPSWRVGCCNVPWHFRWLRRHGIRFVPWELAT